MLSRFPEHALVTLLRQCYTTPKCQAARHGAVSSSGSSRSFHSSSRQFQPRTSSSRHPRDFQARHGRRHDNSYSLRQLSSLTIPENSQENVLQAKGPASPQFQEHQITRIAVLGGGITGLSTAYYLTRELPHAKIAIYEGSERLGGWLQSKRVEVEEGSIVFEQGPRTLRPGTPAGLVTLEMIKHLGLEDQLLITSNSSNAARNRFIYYPDHLVKMPSPGQNLYDMVWSFITEPVFRGMFTGVLFEVTRDQRPTSLDDESIGSFLERRLGSRSPGDNIVSAILHGIYAGDIYQLSIKSLIPRMWYLESMFGSIAQATLNTLQKKTTMMPFADMRLQQEMVAKIKGSLAEKMQTASVYTFKEGIGALSGALEKHLRNNPRVEFKLGQKVSGLEYEPKGDGIMVKTANIQPPQTYTHAISTLSGKHLSALASSLPELANIPTVTVMVVNLYYRSPFLLPERGFGYLIPRSIPFEQNPECALGVVFDSDSTVGQDTAPGTKVTVMLGGHWWDSFAGAGYPSTEEGVSMAKAVLRRHLGITDEPETTQVGLQKDCIPQYVVGHEAILKITHSSLLSAFRGKLSVAGNSYTGVGMNDCVRAARDVVLAIKDKEGGQVTGLEEFRGPRAWVETKIPSKADLERAMSESGGGNE